MPTTLVKETTVYTLEELEEYNYSAYEKAIQKILELAWESSYDRWTWEVESLVDWVDSESLLGIVKKSRFNSKGKQYYEPIFHFNTYPYSLEFEGYINLENFMLREKGRKDKPLYLIYKSLYHGFTKLNIQNDANFKVTGSNDDPYFEESIGDIEDTIIACYKDREITAQQKDKMLDQLSEISNLVWAYVDEWHSKLLKAIREQDSYWNSEEFAKEEAEAVELRFTEDGRIYW